jgi:hypothetical protein
MRCPCCNGKMKYKDKGYWAYPFSTGPEPDYPDWYKKDVYKCTECDIKKVNDEWKIPKKYERATEKQIKTVKFINSMLDKNFEPVLKKQTWEFINKYFEEAQEAKRERLESYYEQNEDLFYDFDFF